MLVSALVGCGNSTTLDESVLSEAVNQPSNTLLVSDDFIADSQSSILTGNFIDGNVEGLNFNTESQSGTTNSLGEYQYIEGETITFSIGSLVFPTVPAAMVLTPFQLASGSANQLPTTLNIARLLQSLDDDGNPDNGIRIPAQARLSAVPVNFDISPIEFENNPNVINLIANSGSVTTTLIQRSKMSFTMMGFTQ